MKEIKKQRQIPVPLVLALCFVLAIGTVLVADTSNFKGVNWADERDNFQSGNIYVSGLSSSDTYASASTVADRVISQFISLLGSNTVRMPINESTVSNYWGTYTGALDKALEKGRLIICYWAPSNGKPANMNNFWSMWDTVVNKYGSNTNCYFEPINEPYGYSSGDLNNLYNDWLNRYSSVPDGRVILDGSGYATGVSNVGSDSRLSGCLLAAHYYTWFPNGSNPYNTISEWENGFQNLVGNYASRTVCTEWGYPNSPGTKWDVYYDYIDYHTNNWGNNYFVPYARGLAAKMDELNIGNTYWIGLRDNDWYSMTIKRGSGSAISLSIPNQSGLDMLHASWGGGSPTPVPTAIPPEAYPIAYSVSSEPEAAHPGSNLLDGNLDGESRWSAQGYPQWVIIDYGQTRQFSSFSLYTYEGRAYQYTIEASNNPNSGYSVVVNRSNNTQTTQPITDTFGTISGRYVRITVSGASGYTGDWISLIELTAEAAAQPTPQTGIKGDVNDDGVVDIVDALLVAQYYVGLNPTNFNQSNADTNCDGSVDIVDALLIAQYYVGLISVFC